MNTSCRSCAAGRVAPHRAGRPPPGRQVPHSAILSGPLLANCGGCSIDPVFRCVPHVQVCVSPPGIMLRTELKFDAYPGVVDLLFPICRNPRLSSGSVGPTAFRGAGISPCRREALGHFLANEKMASCANRRPPIFDDHSPRKGSCPSPLMPYPRPDARPTRTAAVRYASGSGRAPGPGSHMARPLPPARIISAKRCRRSPGPLGPTGLTTDTSKCAPSRLPPPCLPAKASKRP